jgi:hypothetical protein
MMILCMFKQRLWDFAALIEFRKLGWLLPWVFRFHGYFSGQQSFLWLVLKFMIILVISLQFWLFHFLFSTAESFGAGSIVRFLILRLLRLTQMNSLCFWDIRFMDDLNRAVFVYWQEWVGRATRLGPLRRSGLWPLSVKIYVERFTDSFNRRGYFKYCLLWWLAFFLGLFDHRWKVRVLFQNREQIFEWLLLLRFIE